MTRRQLRILCLLVASVLVTGAAGVGLAQDDGLTESPDGEEAVRVYYTPEEALAKVFPKADETWSETRVLDPGTAAALSARLGWHVQPDTLVIHRGRKGDEDRGFAMITEEKGRFKPITFIVKVGADGRVEHVLLMVYRESRGDGVKRQRFLKQFRKKDVDSGMRLNRDIIGVSGATLSSRALSAGVKRVLATLDVLYGEPAR